MIKTKYYYDKETLSYKKIKKTKLGILKSIGLYLIPIFILNLLICVVIFSFFSTPKEILLEKEITQLNSEYKNIEQKIISAEETLKTLSKKDEDIYRIILESDPINQDIRKADFGGVDKYEKFEKFNSTDL